MEVRVRRREPLRVEYGLSNAMVFRDGNNVQVLSEVPDADSAQRFQADPRLREAMKEVGIIGAPEFSGPWN